MKYLVVGDPHAKPSNLDKIEELCNVAESYQLPVIWLGDQLDTKEIIHGKCLNLWYEYYKNSDLKHIILVGNHDKFNKFDNEHSLKVLESLPNITIVSSPVTLDGIDFVPYCDTQTIRNHIEYSNAKLGFGHLDIQGFDYGNGILSKEGFTYEEFDKYDLFISGHYHKKQQRGNIMYLGTPFSHSFAESNQNKVIMKIDTDTLDFHLIPTTFSKHITLEYDCTNDTNIVQSIQNEYNNKDHFRVILKGKQEDIDKINKDIFSNIKFVEKPDLEAQGLVIDETLDHKAQFEKWAKEKQLNEEVLNKGIEVLNNVS